MQYDPQTTAYAVEIDMKNRAYYLRPHDTRGIRSINLNAIEFGTVEFQTGDIYRSAVEF